MKGTSPSFSIGVPTTGTVGEKKYISRCPGCKKTIVRKVGGPAFCSEDCENRLKLGHRKPKAPKKKKKKRIPKRSKKDLNFLERKFGVGFYTSREWLKVKYEAIKRCGAYCMACGRGRRDGATLHADHIKPRSKYPELSLEISNIQILCDECNIGKGSDDETNWRDKMF